MKKFKKIIFVFILISLLAGGFCLAQGKGRELEIEYPGLGVPGVETPTITESSALGDYLKYIFTLAIIIGGLIVFGAMVYGGILYLTSAGDPTKMKDGQDQIMAGFFGLIILLSSYLILNTINPQLVVPETLSAETSEKGIYLCVTPNCVDNPDDFFDTPVPITQGGKYFDLKNILPKREDGSPQDLQSIKFRAKPEDLTVKVYSDSSCSELTYSGNEGAGEIKNISGNSIELIYHWPGVYLYAGKNCDETSEYKIYQISSSTLPDFNNKAQSIKFVYGFSDIGAIQVLKEEGPTEAVAKNIAQARCQERGGDEAEYVTETEYEFQYRCKAEDKKYAAILHKEENSMGEAALFDQEQNTCFNLSDALALNTSPNRFISSCEAAPGCDTNCYECGSQGECEASSASCRWYGASGCSSFPKECDEDCTECDSPQFCGDSKANCYWDDSGFWAKCVSFAECDQNCSECGIENACENSSAGCQWDWFNEECKSVAGCDTDCSKCGTQSACRDSSAYCYWNGSKCEPMPPECDADCSKCTDAGTCSFSKANCEWNLWQSKCIESSGPGCDTDCPKCTHKTDCEASPAGCYWYASQCLTLPSGCNTDCSKCTDFSSCEVSKAVCLWDSNKAKCEPMPSECDDNCSKCNFKEACEKSSANCTWTWENKCELITGCDTNCSNCTNKNTCKASSASCSWDSLKNECRTTVPPPSPDGHGYGADLSGNVSSITIYLKPLEAAPPGGVTFFGDESYTANKDPYILGPYKDAQEQNLEEANNKITSIKIEGHYVALLFDGVNYTGECEVFMSSVNNLRNHRLGQCGWWGRNDCLESFIVRARK